MPPLIKSISLYNFHPRSGRTEELVKMLADRNIPVIAVITKARSDQGFRTEVLHILPLVSNAVRVRAIEEELDEGIVLPAMGLKDLVDLTMQVVPEGLKRAFTAAQKVDIEQKNTIPRNCGGSGG